MKRILRLPIYVLILLGLFVSMIAKADTWDNPRIKTYYSENKEFKLIIIPQKTSDKYYLWDYYKTNKHPQTKKILKQKEKFMRSISEHDTIRIPCTGELLDKTVEFVPQISGQDVPVVSVQVVPLK